ncbi:MAG: tryptophan synthase subunit alpha [candidate division GAL15 bacterium]
MSRLAELFRRVRARGRPALMPFLEAGDPPFAVLERVVRAAVEAGAEALELGVPFSDPVADGPVLQRAAHRALSRGVRLADVLEFVRGVRRQVDVPVALLSYANPLLRYGWERFCRDAVDAGADAVIPADLPADEAQPLVHAARGAGLDTVFLVAPTSTDARLRLAAAASTGFLYCVSLTGITGPREHLSEEALKLLRRVRRLTDRPAVVGFGIATPQHALAVADLADGVIVGSALYRVLEGAGDPVFATREFLRPFALTLQTLR